MPYKNKLIAILIPVFLLVVAWGEVREASAAVSAANTFNRNLKKPKSINPPPPEDGIHDPTNEATFRLQPPREAFKGMPKTTFGNYVDWVKAI